VPIGLYRGLKLEIDLSTQSQLYLGLWERETYSHILYAARRCRWAIDIGAGKEALCLFLLKHSKANKIFAFEPQQKEVDRIRLNLELNGEENSSRISIIDKFVGLGDELTVALDSLDVDVNLPGFIKIDVDGAEIDVINSGLELLGKGKVDIILETHSKALEIESLRLLKKLGYNCTIVKNAWWRILLPEKRPIEHNRWLWATKAF